MPILRPPRRTGVDWLTGEVSQWQSEGWLEADHAARLIREHRTARRDELSQIAGDLGAGLSAVARGLVAAAHRCGSVLRGR